MKTILFICIGNSCRSQIAEAVCRSLYPMQWLPFSAGIAPEPIRKETIITVQQHYNADTSFLYSKSLEVFAHQRFDTVITLCDYAQKHLPFIPQAAHHIHYHITDPAHAKTDIQKIYNDTAKSIEKLLAEITEEIEKRNIFSHR